MEMDEKKIVSLTGWLKKFEFFAQCFLGKIKKSDFLNIRYAVRKSYPINRVRFPLRVTNVKEMDEKKIIKKSLSFSLMFFAEILFPTQNL